MADIPYTLKQLTDVPDAAPGFGLSGVEIRFAGAHLDAERTGFTHHRMTGDAPRGFGHRHDAAEEVYVVLAGSGRARLDDAIVALGPLDALRVAPEVWRGFEAGPDGLELLAFGPRHDGDGEVDPGWWT